jgi:hypothetical protein
VNSNNSIAQFNIIDDFIWENIILSIQKKENLETMNLYIHDISVKYNIDKKNIIKNFLNYIIRNKSQLINTKFLHFVENIIHSQSNNHNNIYYCISRLVSFL